MTGATITIRPKALLPHEPGRWPVSRGLSIAWHKRARVEHGLARTTPSHPANPEYPNGVDVDMTDGAAMRCSATLPAHPGILGQYEILCVTCDLALSLTSAGRLDDPRAVRVACRSRRGRP